MDLASINREDILTDYAGLPLSKEAVRRLRDQCNRHLRTPAKKLAVFGNQVIREHHPAMVGKLSFSPEDFL